MFNRFIANYYEKLGEVCAKKDLPLQAATYFEKAVKKAPQLLSLRKKLIINYFNGGQFDKAEQACLEAIEHHPNDPSNYSNLGKVLQEQARYFEAITAYQTAIKLDPNFGMAHWNLALAYLTLGEYAKGWEEYEWRWKNEYPEKRRNFSEPLWQGENLQGKTLLIYTEQGLGDCIQFSRLIALVKQHHTARIIFEVPISLVTLMQSLETVNVVAAGSVLPTFNFHIPLMSLAHQLKFDPTTDIHPVPYLYADPQKEMLLSESTNKNKRKLAIIWRGNPRHANDKNRSCSLELFLPLMQNEEIQLYSFQFDVTMAEMQKMAQHRIINLAPRIRDMNDTAALMMQMDLIISVDTATAHLAGALGKNCWVLLPYIPDGRWLLQQQSTPWYPTMRLFRQSGTRQWATVLTQIKHALANTHLTAYSKV